jgi:DNA-binding YbaB/EbfC family protein
MNMMKLMKQAQEMQSKMQKMQGEISQRQYNAEVGGVKVVTSGDGNLISLKIDPEFLKTADAEMLEDLITTAFRESLEKGRKEMQNEMGKMTSGMGLPPGLF